MSTVVDVRVVPEPAPSRRSGAHGAEDAGMPARTGSDDAAALTGQSAGAPVVEAVPWRRPPRRDTAEPSTAAASVTDAPSGPCAPDAVRLGTARVAAFSHAPPAPRTGASPVPLPALPPGSAPGAAGTLDARQACCMVAIAAVEVLAGTRPLAQLARWVTPEVYDSLSRRVALTTPRAATHDATAARGPGVAGVPGAEGVPGEAGVPGVPGVPGEAPETGGPAVSPPGPRRPCVRRVRACRSGEHAVEASVVVAHLDRVRAVAVRLTRASGRWRASALVVG